VLGRSTPSVTEPGNTYEARPPRWPVRLFNGLARVKHQIWGPSDPIEAEGILDIAREKTGLDDFGAERARDGLEQLAQSLDTEAHLHPFGRLVYFGGLVDQVSHRLSIIDYLKQKPEIGEEELQRPLLVTGFARSGTSLLHNLLAQDPRSRPLMAWQAAWPVNPAFRDPRGEDTRLSQLQHRFRRVNYLGPDLKTLHALHADRPEECIEFLRLSFVSSAFGVHARIPAYTKWLGAQPPEAWRETYAFYRSQLQIVQDSFANTFHHGLQVKLDKRFSKGLAFGLAYTFSKSHGDGENGGQEGAQFQDPRDCLSCDRGRFRFDQRHNMVGHFVWEMPGQNLDGPIRHILGGWQSNGIISLRSGFPFTLVNPRGDLNVTDSNIRPDRIADGALSDASRKLWFDPTAFQRVTCDVPELVADRCHFENAGYNILDSPGQVNMDFGLFNNFNITETVKYGGPERRIVFSSSH